MIITDLPQLVLLLMLIIAVSLFMIKSFKTMAVLVNIFCLATALVLFLITPGTPVIIYGIVVIPLMLLFLHFLQANVTREAGIVGSHSKWMYLSLAAVSMILFWFIINSWSVNPKFIKVDATEDEGSVWQNLFVRYGLLLDCIAIMFVCMSYWFAFRKRWSAP